LQALCLLVDFKIVLSDESGAPIPILPMRAACGSSLERPHYSPGQFPNIATEGLKDDGKRRDRVRRERDEINFPRIANLIG
jgi:hypothetical protein